MLELILGILGGLILAWLAMALVLLVARPKRGALTDFMRLLPDTLRLLRGLLRDPAVPLSAKALVGLLLGYVALPIDLVPDFIPFLGYADDAIVAAIVLRFVIRRAGPAKVREHWHGSPGGLAALLRASR
jgi:uncharacterized membrane protein YkvA (DUF1232 family)